MVIVAMRSENKIKVRLAVLSGCNFFDVIDYIVTKAAVFGLFARITVSLPGIHERKATVAFNQYAVGVAGV